MDPIRNPYAPGAGTPPPELAGRDDIRDNARAILGRSVIGRPAGAARALLRVLDKAPEIARRVLTGVGWGKSLWT